MLRLLIAVRGVCAALIASKLVFASGIFILRGFLECGYTTSRVLESEEYMLAFNVGAISM